MVPPLGYGDAVYSLVALNIATKKRVTLKKDNSLIYSKSRILLCKCSRNVYRDSYSSTYHGVVTDAEEAHHLNVCGN